MIDTLLQLFFPERCIACHKPGSALCIECSKDIPAANSIDSDVISHALYNYSHPIVRKAIWQLKYYRQSSLTKALLSYKKDIIAAYINELQQNNPGANVVLVPIPQQYRKTFQRGFNQSALLTKWLVHFIPQATVAPLLHKTTATISQARTQSKAERIQNMKNTMSIKHSNTTIGDTALYIVVDDVITTGSTITEASRALRAAGAKHIYGLAIAHGYAVSGS